MSKPIGVGIAYRPYFRDALETGQLRVDHVEFATEQIVYSNFVSKSVLRIANKLPCLLHSVSWSPGSHDFIKRKSLASAMATCMKSLAPQWVSEHISFSGDLATDAAQLLPLRRTKESVGLLSRSTLKFEEVHQSQTVLEYITRMNDPGGEMDEGNFVAEALSTTGAGLLLDLHNVYANSINFDFDPYALLKSLPVEHAIQVHIAGGRWEGTTYLDSHDAPVPEDVWSLLRYVVTQVRPKAITLERDGKFGAISETNEELIRARSILSESSAPCALFPRKGSISVKEAEVRDEVRYQSDLLAKVSSSSATRIHGLPDQRKRRTLEVLEKSLPRTYPLISTAAQRDWKFFYNRFLSFTHYLEKIESVICELQAMVPYSEQWKLEVDVAIIRLGFHSHETSRTVEYDNGQKAMRIELLENGKVLVRQLEKKRVSQE